MMTTCVHLEEREAASDFEDIWLQWIIGRVTLTIAFDFFSKILEKWQGAMNAILSVFECNLSS